MPALGFPARLALCAPVLAALACGSSQYTYVKNSDAGLYVKVPRAWGSINPDEVHTWTAGDATTTDGKISRQHAWYAAFDAAPAPSIQNVFGDAPSDPVVWMFVRDVPPAERAALSLNAMRDLVHPLGQVIAMEGAAEAGFELVANRDLHPEKGLYGLHTVFNYKIAGVSQTMDQTVLTNDRQSKLFYLVVKCSTKCFHDRRDEISTVVDSFTVRG